MLHKRNIILVFFLILFFINIKSYASTKVEGIENFPDSYKPYLYELKTKYPNWTFVSLHTGLDWNTVIANEYVYGKNLVPLSYTDAWKCTDPGVHNVVVDAGWVNAGRRAVEYCIDPRNFLNQTNVFMFESLSYDANMNTKDGVEKVLYGTEFYNRGVIYKDSSGINHDMGTTYSDLIMSSAGKSNVSAYHLASRIRQEVGPFLSHNSISGTISGYEGLYNFYNIGATSDPNPLQVIKNGLQYAKDGKGANQSTKDKYLIPWTDPDKSITGGATFIGSSYISQGQNTLYLQKFDVNDEKPGELFWHQYMTNVLAPYSESSSIFRAYQNNGMLGTALSFIIPVYNNMPAIPTASPNINLSDFVADNTKVYADVTGTLNVRSGPGTEYEPLTRVTKDDVLTRISRYVGNGEQWEKVITPNGITGYVFKSYIKELPPPKISEINLACDNTTINKGTLTNIRIEIIPEDAKNNTVIWETDNSSIAIVDNSGIVTGVNPGTVTITAKNEDNTISKSITLTINSPVTDLNIDKDNITISKGETAQINATVVPEDATNKNIIYSSDNTDIATIDNTGLITGINKGVTTLRVVSENGNIEKNCTINITELNEGDSIIINDGLIKQGNDISGINLAEAKVENIKSQISTNLNIVMLNYQNAELSDTDNVGTGTRVIFKDSNNDVVSEYNIVLYGDVSGDGNINALDTLMLQKHILETTPLKGLFLKAGNIAKNGNPPSALDVLKVQRHILEISNIPQ